MKETIKYYQKRRTFRHLNQGDRDRIEALLTSGHHQNEIANILNFDCGAISREINRRKQKDGVYIASVAHHKARVKRSNSKYQGMKIQDQYSLRQFVITELKNHRSPDEIAGRLKKEKWKMRVGKDAIYKWLYSPYGQPYCKLLCTKRYKKRRSKRLPKREMIPHRVSIALRPKCGVHAEGDLFVSPTKTGVQRSGSIVCVPVAQLLVGTMIENKKPETMVVAVQKIARQIVVDDYTWDNGMENRRQSKFGTKNYFADPYSPYQKPNVENGIGLLRRWFIKKKTNLINVSEEQYQNYLHILNSKWRKSLGYQSAYEVALKRGIIQKIPVLGMGTEDLESEEKMVKINTPEVAFH